MRAVVCAALRGTNRDEAFSGPQTSCGVGDMTDTPVQYVLEGTTAIVRMDDGKANALSETMIDALVAATCNRVRGLGA